jgi:glycosyltransferase involved in cell wall biosynthesis
MPDPQPNPPDADCAVVIPCLNEERTIGPLVRSVRRSIPTVLVVDDGSTDATTRLAAEAGATVISHPRNLGKGAALKTGLTAAMARGLARAVVMDGDGQHDPADIPVFFGKFLLTGAALVVGNRMGSARNTGSALVVGNRMGAPAAIPWLRRRVNRWMSRRISREAGRELPDTQCGFRLLDLGAWAGLPCRTRHFEVESEMLLGFLNAGYTVEFVPIRVIGRAAHSHINPITDTWRWWRWWRSLGTPRSRPLAPRPSNDCAAVQRSGPICGKSAPSARLAD